jgi:predicted nucleotidyltransferase
MPHSRNGAACRTPNLMEEFSRPATLEDLKLLLRSLNEHSVDYLLIGGYALAAHGYQRATIDIDLLVPGNAASGQRIKDALMVLPDQAAKELEPEWFAEGENIRVADAFIVDLLLNANGQSFDTLNHYAQTIDLDGIPVKTVSLEGLLLTKQTMRDKDVHDRILIERALNILRNSTNDLHDQKNS